MNYVSLFALVSLLLLASIFDFRSRRIPNALVFIGAGSGLVLRIWSEGIAGMLDSVEGLTLGIAFLLPFYILRTVGAGDVKLMGAVGSFLGPQDMFGAVLCSFAAGGLLALAASAWSGTLRKLAINLKGIFVGGMLDVGQYRMPSLRVGAESVGSLPYAIAITAGVISWIYFGTSH